MVVALRISGTDSTEIIGELREGGVAKLLSTTTAWRPGRPTSCDGARLVDRAIATALATDAKVLAVPRLAMMDGPLAATMRC